MCNANNHPPDCNCGWGGVWYGNTPYGVSQDFTPSNNPRPRLLGEQKGTSSRLSSELCSPNANCPVCGTRVFFYTSPYGGKVFFDELGPPWPKHPCTSHDYVPTGSRATNSHTPWNQDQWIALSSVSTEATQDAGVYKITGQEGFYKTVQFYFSAAEVVMAEIVRFKKRDVGEFYISILDYDTVNKTWQTWSGIVYTSKVMTKTGIGRLTKTYVPPDNNIPKTPSPPEPAAGPVPAATTTPQPVRPEHPSKVFPPQDLEPCIFCKVLVKHKNMKRHVHRTHPALAAPVKLIVYPKISS